MAIPALVFTDMAESKQPSSRSSCGGNKSKAKRAGGPEGQSVRTVVI